MFMSQASSTIRRFLRPYAERGALARNYAITTMRDEIPARCEKWMALNWVLRYASNPGSPVICSDQSIGMTGDIEEERFAMEDPLEHPSTILFFPVAWDMCLFGVDVLGVAAAADECFALAGLQVEHRHLRVVDRRAG